MAGFEQTPVRGREFVETGVEESAGSQRSGRDPIEQRSRKLARRNPTVIPQFAFHRVHPAQKCIRVVEAVKLRRVARRFPGVH